MYCTCHYHTETDQIYAIHLCEIYNNFSEADRANFELFKGLWKKHRGEISAMPDLQAWISKLWKCLVSRSDLKQKRTEIGKILIDKTTVHILQEEGEANVFSLACKNGLQDVVQLFTRKFGDRFINNGSPHPLWNAAAGGHSSLIAMFHKCKSLKTDLATCSAPDGTTPIMMAMIKQHRDTIKQLTKIYSASDVIREVVSLGDVKLFDEVMKTSDMTLPATLLNLAVESGNPKMVEKFLQTQPDKKFQTSVASNKREVLKLLETTTSQKGQLTNNKGVSQLTKMSAHFPLFNDDAESKPKWRKKKRWCFAMKDDVEQIILDPVCCFQKTHTIDEATTLSCMPNCPQ